MSLTGYEQVKRGQVLKSIRDAALEIWKRNPSIKAAVLREVLEQDGHDISGVGKSTVHTWVARWNEKEQKVTAPSEEKASKPTWEQVIEAIPDIETLGVLVLEGMMHRIAEKDSAYELLQADNIRLQDDLNAKKSELDKMTRRYNELLAKGQVGHLEVDQTKHRLVHKQ